MIGLDYIIIDTDRTTHGHRHTKPCLHKNVYGGGGGGREINERGQRGRERGGGTDSEREGEGKIIVFLFSFQALEFH